METKCEKGKEGASPGAFYEENVAFPWGAFGTMARGKEDIYRACPKRAQAKMSEFRPEFHGRQLCGPRTQSILRQMLLFLKILTIPVGEIARIWFLYASDKWR